MTAPGRKAIKIIDIIENILMNIGHKPSLFKEIIAQISPYLYSGKKFEPAVSKKA